jgi:hypothetical protein
MSDLTQPRGALQELQAENEAYIRMIAEEARIIEERRREALAKQAEFLRKYYPTQYQEFLERQKNV